MTAVLYADGADDLLEALPLGVHFDTPAETYHADPALSSTVVRRLLDAPAKARPGAVPRVEKDSFDLGHVAHRLVLGRGEEYAVSPYDDYRSQAARAWRDEQRDAGRTPIKAADLDRAQAMADAVLEHPVAGRLFAPGTFDAEVVVVADLQVPGTDRTVRCRAMFDALRWTSREGLGDDEEPLLGADLKTTSDGKAHPRRLGSTLAGYRYDVQEEWYRRILHAATGVWVPFVFALVEKDPPHLVAVAELDDPSRDVAARDVDRALVLWDDATRTGVWPGYPSDVHLVSTPRYLHTREDD